jgi:murein DD-endopeptidase MepM/ murein hydrolase activator NlpD
VLLIALLIALLVPAAPARGAALEGWRWPVAGPVLQPFALSADRFAAGQHRGIDIGAARGSPVRAACTGRVTFAGVAGPSGRTVTLVCGRYVTTYLHLGSAAVARGATIAAGHRIGTVGTSGTPRLRAVHLQFDVRLVASRWAYVDPLSVLPDPDAGPRQGPLGPAPRAGRPVRRRRLPPPRPRFATAPVRPAVRPAHAPLAVWLALALLASAVPGSLLASNRARKRVLTRSGRRASAR